MIHDIVTSDIFALLIGMAGIIAAIASTLALLKVSKIVNKKKMDSNQSNNQNLNLRGDGNQIAGRDIKRD